MLGGEVDRPEPAGVRGPGRTPVPPGPALSAALSRTGPRGPSRSRRRSSGTASGAGPGKR
ncbi:hypothetical protein ACWDNT_05125 [Streptomyces sp. NPDC000963]